MQQLMLGQNIVQDESMVISGSGGIGLLGYISETYTLRHNDFVLCINLGFD